MRRRASAERRPVSAGFVSRTAAPRRGRRREVASRRGGCRGGPGPRKASRVQRRRRSWREGPRAAAGRPISSRETVPRSPCIGRRAGPTRDRSGRPPVRRVGARAARPGRPRSGRPFAGPPSPGADGRAPERDYSARTRRRARRGGSASESRSASACRPPGRLDQLRQQHLGSWTSWSWTCWTSWSWMKRSRLADRRGRPGRRRLPLAVPPHPSAAGSDRPSKTLHGRHRATRSREMVGGRIRVHPPEKRASWGFYDGQTQHRCSRIASITSR